MACSACAGRDLGHRIGTDQIQRIDPANATIDEIDS